MKDKKNITNSAEDRLSLWEFNLKKSIIYFLWFRSYKFFNEALQPRFFAKKMTQVKNYRVSNNNCFSWQKKNLHKIFKTELYLFRFVLLTLLTAGIHIKFKRLGFCNLLLFIFLVGT
jgi:hypothetical protein